MLLDEALRRQALDSATRFEALSDAGKASAAVSALSAGTRHMVPVLVAIAVLADMLARAAKKTAEDPPRGDWESATWVELQGLRDRFPDDELGRTTVPLLFAAQYASKFLEAMVESHEKAEAGMHSSQHHTANFIQRRIDEGVSFAYLSWLALGGTAEAAERLASILPEPLRDAIPQEPIDLAALAFDPDLGFLLDARVIEGAGDLLRLGDKPISTASFFDELVAGGASARDLGEEILRWVSSMPMTRVASDGG